MNKLKYIELDNNQIIIFPKSINYSLMMNQFNDNVSIIHSGYVYIKPNGFIQSWCEKKSTKFNNKNSLNISNLFLNLNQKEKENKYFTFFSNKPIQPEILKFNHNWLLGNEPFEVKLDDFSIGYSIKKYLNIQNNKENKFIDFFKDKFNESKFWLFVL